MIEHEQVLERNPSATELAASTFRYAKAKERYFVERACLDYFSAG
jgi:hypothetical protein